MAPAKNPQSYFICMTECMHENNSNRDSNSNTKILSLSFTSASNHSVCHENGIVALLSFFLILRYISHKHGLINHARIMIHTYSHARARTHIHSRMCMLVTYLLYQEVHVTQNNTVRYKQYVHLSKINEMARGNSMLCDGFSKFVEHVGQRCVNRYRSCHFSITGNCYKSIICVNR